MPIPLNWDFSLQDLNRAVICTPDDENLQKSIDKKNLAKKIANKSGKRVKEIANKSGKRVTWLTKFTGNCLPQTCNGFIELL